MLLPTIIDSTGIQYMLCSTVRYVKGADPLDNIV